MKKHRLSASAQLCALMINLQAPALSGATLAALHFLRMPCLAACHSHFFRIMLQDVCPAPIRADLQVLHDPCVADSAFCCWLRRLHKALAEVFCDSALYVRAPPVGADTLWLLFGQTN